MTGADWLRLLRRHLDDMPGDVSGLADPDYDPVTCRWTPTELAHYFNAGWEELCLRAPIHDASSVVALVTVPGGVGAAVALHPCVLWVERVTQANVLLSRLWADDLDDAYSTSAQPWEEVTGTPTGYLLSDERPLALRLFPAPVADTALRLAVRRGPRVPLCADDGDNNLEDDLVDPLGVRDGQAVIWWATSLAYQRPDADTYSEGLAAQNQARFEQQVGPRPDVREVAFKRAAAGRPPMRVRVHW
jgi:hypothetical protein